MVERDRLHRRAAIKIGFTGALAGVAGCLGDDDDESAPTDDDSDTTDEIADDDTDDDDGVAGAEPGERVRTLEFKFMSPDYDPVRYEAGLFLADIWEEIGFDIERVPLDVSRAIEDIIIQNDYDIAFMEKGPTPDRIDPQHFIHDMLHSNNRGEGESNLSHYNNPDYDRLAEEQATKWDLEERREIVYECQEIFAEEQPMTPFVHPPQVHLYNTDAVDPDSITRMISNPLNSFWNQISMEPVEGNSITTTTIVELANTNPIRIDTVDEQEAIGLWHDRLLRIDPDGEITTWAAEDFDVVDETTVRIDLREGMTWHDGEPVTIEDVKFSFEFQKEHSPTWAGPLSTLSHVEIVDDHAADFVFEEPFAPALANVFAAVFLIPKHRWEGVEDPQEYEDPEAIGSGPFQFEEHQRGELHVISRFDDHFNPPNTERLFKSVASGFTAVFNQLEQGEVDMAIRSLPPEPSIRLAEEQDNIEIETEPSFGAHHTWYQMSREPLDDKAVRRAFAHATPKDELNESFWEGLGDIPHTQISEDLEFWHNPDAERFEFDTDAARQELEDAGYSWDDEGYLVHPE